MQGGVCQACQKGQTLNHAVKTLTLKGKPYKPLWKFGYRCIHCPVPASKTVGPNYLWEVLSLLCINLICLLCTVKQDFSNLSLALLSINLILCVRAVRQDLSDNCLFQSLHC